MMLEDLTIAIACSELSTIRELLADQAKWVEVGRDSNIGIDAICRAVDRRGQAGEVLIEHVMSHGKSGAVNGTASYGANQTAFCRVFEFSNAKGASVRSISTYSIPVA
jgi:hypothetical protein